MESHNVVDFNGVIKDIEGGKVLLPDFQRDFKWKDIKQQKGLIASVFARLPIGSILLLNSDNKKEYEANEIGCKHVINWDDEKFDNSKVSFLLDGQQRLTVLTNVFSNVIFNKWNDWQKDPLHTSLKRRFFLKIPRWEYGMSKDIFGVKELDYNLLKTKIPSFLSDDVEPMIKAEEITKGAFNKVTNEPPYHPEASYAKDTLRKYCLAQKDYYLLPLFLLYSDDSKSVNMYTRILNSIAVDLSESINSYYENIDDSNLMESENFVKEFLGEDSLEYSEFKENEKPFDEIINEKAGTWKDSFKQYIDTCINNMYLTEIIMEDEEKARAINVYERLNEGGVALSTFDLIIAKASSDIRCQGSFKTRFIDSVGEDKIYPENLLPECLASIYTASKPYENENASIKMGVIDSDDEVVKAYSDTFLTVLSLHCHNKNRQPDGYGLPNTKKKAILELKAEEINDNLQLVCTSIDRALFFLQSRCGIRKITEINYKNMITVLAVIFINDEYFNDKKIHDKLEAWYWSSVFSGSYDSDQNSRMELDIKNLLVYFTKYREGDSSKPAWFADQIKKIFAKEDFSDFDTLAMKNTEADRYPKAVIQESLCHYMLSFTYPLLLSDNAEKISVYTSRALDAHHIVPLASNLDEKMAAKEKELSVRDKKDSKYNSPLNYVFIDAVENGTILDLPANTYLKSVTNKAKSALKINHMDPDNINEFLEYRFKEIKGMMENELENLMV